MQPTLPAGSLLAIRPLTSLPLPGDVVVFVEGSELIAHRLMRRIQSNRRVVWIAQGDNCPLPDPPFPPDRIVGRVCTAVYAGQIVWSGHSQGIGRWRWLGRYYLLAVIRRLRRALPRSLQCIS